MERGLFHLRNPAGQGLNTNYQTHTKENITDYRHFSLCHLASSIEHDHLAHFSFWSSSKVLAGQLQILILI